MGQYLMGRLNIFGGTPRGSGPNNEDFVSTAVMVAVFILLLGWILWSGEAHAATTHLPGEDMSDKLQAAGTLLRLIDTGLFKWGARIFAGLCIMSAGWSLKEQRFGIAIICVIGAIVFGTAPMWVKNIFEIGGGNGVFSSIQTSAHTLFANLTSGRGTRV
jgi:hypothetical protein